MGGRWWAPREGTGTEVYITRIYRVGSRERRDGGDGKEEEEEEEGRREGPREGWRGGESGQIRSSDSELAVLSVTFRSLVREVGPAPVRSASRRVSCTLNPPTVFLSSSPRSPRT